MYNGWKDEEKSVQPPSKENAKIYLAKESSFKYVPPFSLLELYWIRSFMRWV